MPLENNTHFRLKKLQKNKQRAIMHSVLQFLVRSKPRNLLVLRANQCPQSMFLSCLPYAGFYLLSALYVRQIKKFSSLPFHLICGTVVVTAQVGGFGTTDLEKTRLLMSLTAVDSEASCGRHCAPHNCKLKSHFCLEAYSAWIRHVLPAARNSTLQFLTSRFKHLFQILFNHKVACVINSSDRSVGINSWDRSVGISSVNRNVGISSGDRSVDISA